MKNAFFENSASRWQAWLSSLSVEDGNKLHHWLNKRIKYLLTIPKRIPPASAFGHALHIESPDGILNLAKVQTSKNCEIEAKKKFVHL